MRAMSNLDSNLEIVRFINKLSIETKYKELSSAATIEIWDSNTEFSCKGTFTLTLTEDIGLYYNWKVKIVNASSGAITISAPSLTINSSGSASPVLGAYSSTEISFDGDEFTCVGGSLT